MTIPLNLLEVIKTKNIINLEYILSNKIVYDINSDEEKYSIFLREVRTAIYQGYTKEVGYIVKYFFPKPNEGKFSNKFKDNKIAEDIFAIVLSCDNRVLAKWMLKYDFIKQQKHIPLKILHKILTFTGGGIRGFKDPTQKEKIIKYFLRYDYVKNELKDMKIYNYIVSRSSNSSILSIILEEIKDKPYFKNAWRNICIQLAKYDHLDNLINLEAKKYFPINYKMWKKIFINNLNSHDLDIIKYFHRIEFSSFIQKTINATEDNKTLWLKEKIETLENLGYDFLSPNFYYKVINLQEYYNEIFSNRGIDADILLEALRERFVNSPELITRLDLDKVYSYHKEEFKSIYDNYNFYEKLIKKIDLSMPNKIESKKKKI